MATYTDNFNNLGTALLSTRTGWKVSALSGTGVPLGDLHNDHSDLTTVVDMSGVGSTLNVYGSLIGSPDHEVETESFVDEGNATGNQMGSITRGTHADPANAAFCGYVGTLELTTGGQTRARIYRCTNRVLTQIADVASPLDRYTRRMVKLKSSGSTHTLYIGGIEATSVTDATHTAGEYGGVLSNRNESTTTSQPFFDNWTAASLSAPPAGPAGTFLQAVGTDATQTTYTFAAQNLGAAAADRHIIVGVNARLLAATAGSIASVTVGGVAATSVVQHSNDSGSSNRNTSALFIAAVPTGTTGDVVVTVSREALRCGIALYRATDINTTAVSTGSGAGSPSGTFTSPDGTFAVALSSVASGGTTWTWTGLTEDSELTFGTTALSTASGNGVTSFAATPSGAMDNTAVWANFTTGAAPASTKKIYVGATQLSKVYVGATEILKAYVGTTLVWSP